MSTFNNTPSPSDMQNQNGYEKSVVHPAVAQWLLDNGYSYVYEARILNSGRADFVAHHESGHVMIIEAKKSGVSLHKTIAQVKGYCIGYGGNPEPAIAIPEYIVTDDIQNACDIHGVRLLTFDLPEDEPDEEYTRDPFADATVQNLINAGNWFHETWKNPSIALRNAISGYLDACVGVDVISKIFLDQYQRYNQETEDHDVPHIRYLGNPSLAYLRFLYVCLETKRDDSWIKARTTVSIEDIRLIRAVNTSCPDPYARFSEIRKLICLKLFARTLHDLSIELHVSDDAELCDHLPTMALQALDASEHAIAVKMEQSGGFLTDDEQMAIVDIVVSNLAPGFRANAEYLGMDLPTGRPLLKKGAK
jgi:hypothetical protein